MNTLQTFITLMAAAVLLVGLAQKIRIPYPLALVLGGAAIGFIPGLIEISFDPGLIQVVVLPPILNSAAFSISSREFKRNWKDIFSLAIGLVVATTLVIGLLFKWLFPQSSWALAFAFGAVISPPDAIAVTAILRRFSVGPRLLAVLEGESLVNDATGLVLYKMAVVALLTGVFSLPEAGMEFVKVVSGGIFLGALVGYLCHKFSKHYLDPVVAVVFSFLIPYFVYILADSIGVSGVLAVVVNGLIGARLLITHNSSLRRILGWSAWDIFIIFLNCFVFILIGSQLRNIVNKKTSDEIIQDVLYGFLVTFAMIIVRMAWVYCKKGLQYLRKRNNPAATRQCSQIFRDAAILGWSGMRGIVSLTAALSLPYTFPDGSPIAFRDTVIFITFNVILLSLLIPGLTLPILIRWLKIRCLTDDNSEQVAREKLAAHADAEIDRIVNLREEERAFLKSYFSVRRRILELATSKEVRQQNLERARVKVIQAQRRLLVNLWESREIDDKLLRILEHELDRTEDHLARIEIS